MVRISPTEDSVKAAQKAAPESRVDRASGSSMAGAAAAVLDLWKTRAG
jgi:hypothetical protein